MKNKTIVVTGGAGFIGSHLCERLSADNRVISLDNYSFGSTENHVPNVEYRTGDTVSISDHIPELVDYVFHLGEYARVEQSFEAVQQVFDSNICGTHAVLEYVRKNGAKLIYAGSSTKFADAGIGKDQSPYAWTKATNTNLVQRYAEWFTIDYAITYFYNVYGPRERSDIATGTLISIFKEKYTHGMPLTVRAPGTQRRNFTHVDDIVDGLILVGARGQGDEYGLGHQDSYSVLEVAEMFGGSIEMIPERMGNRMDSTVDIHRARLELGWEPKRNLPEYIRDVKNEKN